MSGGRLPILKPREVVRVLERHGFEYVGGRGSHRKYKKGGLTVIVPFHPGDDIPPGTLNNIIKSSGLGREAFS